MTERRIVKPIPLPSWWDQHRGEYVATRRGYGREILVAHHEDPLELHRILREMGETGVVMERVPRVGEGEWMGGGLEITYSERPSPAAEEGGE